MKGQAFPFKPILPQKKDQCNAGTDYPTLHETRTMLDKGQTRTMLDKGQTQFTDTRYMILEGWTNQDNSILCVHPSVSCSLPVYAVWYEPFQLAENVSASAAWEG